MRRDPDETGIIGSPIGGGSDPGDLGCVLHYNMWYPTAGVNPTSPTPVVLGHRSAHYSLNGTEPYGTLTDIADNLGFIAIYFETRLMLGGAEGGAGLPGQITDGRAPQQINDVSQAIRWIRADARCNQFVLGVGGSGSAGNTLHKALVGTRGDDLFDAVVVMSAPTDASDRDPDMYQRIINIMCDYYHADPNDTSQATLDRIRSESPIGNIGNDPSPIFHYNGGLESTGIPPSQFNLFSDAMSGVTNYTGLFVAESRNHSFGAWQPWVREPSLPWITEQYNNWINGNTGGGGGGGGEETGLLDYSWSLTGGAGGPTGGRISGDDLSSILIGLDPGLAYVFGIAPNNEFGEGDWSYFPFTSDRAKNQGGGTSGRVPTGMIDLLPTVNGQLPGIENLPVWDDKGIIGCRLHTNWANVEPTNGNLDTTLIEDFLNLCKAHKKRGAISIAGGTGSPTWFTNTVTLFTDSDGNSFPVPWDQSYISAYNDMILRVGAIYNGDSRLSHVVMALGSYDTAQSYVLLGDTSDPAADVNNLTALAATAGFDSIVEGWEVWCKSVIRNYSTVFTSQSLVVDLYYAVPTGVELAEQSVTDLVSIAQHSNIGSRLCLMSETLTDTTDGTGLIEFNVIQGTQYGFGVTGVSGSSTIFQSWMTAGVNLAPNYIEIRDADEQKSTPYPTIISTTAQQLRDAQAAKRQ
jgi:hypothetical protein